ncbi:MAG TPA: hypothetical protein VIQ51_17605 [Chryseosolibacter sp.]
MNNTNTFKKVATQVDAQAILASLIEVRGAWEKLLSFNEMDEIFRRCDKILEQYKK